MNLLLFASLFVNISKSILSRHIKFLYFGILVSVTIMNFVSNSYIARFQMAQLFWLFMGIFYALERMRSTRAAGA